MVKLKVKELSALKLPQLLTIICIGTVFFELYLGVSHCLFHQLNSPVLNHPDLDLTFWFFIALRIPFFFTQNPYIALFCDSLLIFLPLLVCFNQKRICIWILFILLFIQHITLSNFAMHHSHIFLGFIFIWIPFLFKKQEQTSLALEGVRFIMLFSYFSAFLWKLFRGNYFYLDQFSTIIKENMLPYMMEYPNSFFSHLYQFLFDHPLLTFIIGLFGLILEGIFIVGFFTKKWDLFLFYLSIFIHLCFWIFTDAFEFPLLILSLTLIPSFKLIQR